MKPLITLILLSLATPQATQATKVQLLIRAGGKDAESSKRYNWQHMPVALERIEMESIDDLEEQGASLMASTRFGSREHLGFECLIGK